MDYKRAARHVSVLSSIIISGVFILTNFVGCKPCYPSIKKFSCSPPSYVCPGDTVNLSYEFHLNKSNGDPCDPQEECLMSIKNETDGTMIPGEQLQSNRISKGVYVNKNPIPVVLDHSARLTFYVAGDSECEQRTTRSLVIPVIGENGGRHAFGYKPGEGPWVPTGIKKKIFDSIKIDSTLSVKEAKGPSPWMEVPVTIFGATVLVDSLENPHPFDVEVKYKGTSVILPAYGNSSEHRGLQANGTWALRIDQEIYDQNILVLIIIYLKCTL